MLFLLKKAKNQKFDDDVSLNSPLFPSLLVMCCAGGEGMPKSDQDGGPVALQWGRLIRSGGQSLKSFSAPGGVTCHPLRCSRVLCARAQLGSMTLQRVDTVVALVW